MDVRGCWCSGFGLVNSYEYTPGQPAKPPIRWPGSSMLQPRRGKANLVMMAHPRCPCTRASIGELEQLMATVPGRLAAQVIFYKPSASEPDWETSDLWDRAAAIPGVVVAWDADGRQAALFGAATSGQVVVYNVRGDLLFSGGVTASRGHSGDNVWRSSIVSAVTTGAPLRTATPVFGCSLVDSRPRPTL